MENDPGFNHHLMWCMTVLALAGTALNTFMRKECFYLWIVANLVFAAHNARIKQWPQAALFFAYFVLAIVGIVYWSAVETQ